MILGAVPTVWLAQGALTENIHTVDTKGANVANLGENENENIDERYQQALSRLDDVMEEEGVYTTEVSPLHWAFLLWSSPRPGYVLFLMVGPFP